MTLTTAQRKTLERRIRRAVTVSDGSVLIDGLIFRTRGECFNGTAAKYVKKAMCRILIRRILGPGKKGQTK